MIVYYTDHDLKPAHKYKPIEEISLADVITHRREAGYFAGIVYFSRGSESKVLKNDHSLSSESINILPLSESSLIC